MIGSDGSFRASSGRFRGSRGSFRESSGRMRGGRVEAAEVEAAEASVEVAEGYPRMYVVALCSSALLVSPWELPWKLPPLKPPLNLLY